MVFKGEKEIRHQVDFRYEDLLRNPQELRQIKEEDESLLNTIKVSAPDGEYGLIIEGGVEFWRCKDEYRILKYQWKNSEHYGAEEYLNSFIKAINVSVVDGGIRSFWKCSKNHFKSKKVSCKLVAYYEDLLGVNHIIHQVDICNFLFQSPNLFITDNGLLIFYTDTAALVTMDCNIYSWINIKLGEGETISEIKGTSKTTNTGERLLEIVIKGTHDYTYCPNPFYTRRLTGIVGYDITQPNNAVYSNFGRPES